MHYMIADHGRLHSVTRAAFAGQRFRRQSVSMCTTYVTAHAQITVPT